MMLFTKLAALVLLIWYLLAVVKEMMERLRDNEKTAFLLLLGLLLTPYGLLTLNLLNHLTLEYLK